MDNQEYFADKSVISNSQLRNFVSYSKYGARLLTPDNYIAYNVDESVKFKQTEPIIVGKIVDKYFDGTGDKVWEKYIPVAKRLGKEIQALIDQAIEESSVKNTDIEGEYSEEETKAWETEKQNITDQINDEYMEITKGMKSDAEEMIVWGKAFKHFKEFLCHDDTEAQVKLKTEVPITDAVTGLVTDVEMKGMPDYVNHKLKKIVDLKTTGSMSMIIEDLQFKGDPKLTANYIRQLAIYNKLCGGGYSVALALVTATGVKWIDIPSDILDEAWIILERDILDLDKFLKTGEVNESIFVKQDLESTPLDDLNLN